VFRIGTPTNEYFHVSLWAYGPLRRIGNRVRIPNGTAAVCVLYPLLIDENQSLGNWEGRVRMGRALPGAQVRRTAWKRLLCLCLMTGRVSNPLHRNIGCGKFYCHGFFAAWRTEKKKMDAKGEEKGHDQTYIEKTAGAFIGSIDGDRTVSGDGGCHGIRQ